jgi:hypothetical protein
MSRSQEATIITFDKFPINLNLNNTQTKQEHMMHLFNLQE